MDEWGGLESRCGFRLTVGSNPTLSAKKTRVFGFWRGIPVTEGQPKLNNGERLVIAVR